MGMIAGYEGADTSNQGLRSACRALEDGQVSCKDSRSLTFNSTAMKSPIDKIPMMSGTRTEADDHGCSVPPLRVRHID